MATTIKPTVSKKNPYYIPKHRYYELKHFCLQYPEWRKEYRSIYLEPGSITSNLRDVKQSDRTSKLALRRLYLQRNMELVEQAAIAADSELKDFILMSVTVGVSYEFLQTQKYIPCCRETFYTRRRKFFKILSDIRK